MVCRLEQIAIDRTAAMSSRSKIMYIFQYCLANMICLRTLNLETKIRFKFISNCGSDDCGTVNLLLQGHRKVLKGRGT